MATRQCLPCRLAWIKSRCPAGNQKDNEWILWGLPEKEAPIPVKRLCQNRLRVPRSWSPIEEGFRLNPLSAEVCHLNFHPLEVVGRRRDPQLQVGENY